MISASRNIDLKPVTQLSCCVLIKFQFARMFVRHGGRPEPPVSVGLKGVKGAAKCPRLQFRAQRKKLISTGRQDNIMPFMARSAYSARSDAIVSEEAAGHNVPVFCRIVVTEFRSSVAAHNVWVTTVHIENTDIS